MNEKKRISQNVSLMNINTDALGYEVHKESVRMQGSLSSFR